MLGFFADAVFQEEALNLHARDTLVMFTDGVTEARSMSDEEFGEERLMDSLITCATCPPTAFLENLLSAVRGFCAGAEQSDDVTVTVTRFMDPARQ